MTQFLDKIARSDNAMQDSTIKILSFQRTKITEIFWEFEDLTILLLSKISEACDLSLFLLIVLVSCGICMSLVELGSCKLEKLEDDTSSKLGNMKADILEFVSSKSRRFDPRNKDFWKILATTTYIAISNRSQLEFATSPVFRTRIWLRSTVDFDSNWLRCSRVYLKYFWMYL